MTRARAGRRLWVAASDKTCGRCKQPIPKGAEHFRDVSGSPQHPACVRLRVKRYVPPPPLVPSVVLLAPVEKVCAGCEFGFDAGERIDHLNGKPYHRACRV